MAFLLPSTDFALGLKCQKPGEILVNCPHSTAGDGEYPYISRRLQHYAAADLSRKATWQINYYKDTVNCTRIERELKHTNVKWRVSVIIIIIGLSSVFSMLAWVGRFPPIICGGCP